MGAIKRRVTATAKLILATSGFIRAIYWQPRDFFQVQNYGKTNFHPPTPIPRPGKSALILALDTGGMAAYKKPPTYRNYNCGN
jgi:hypothetical protein